ncbi:hypothetical protein BKA70DRAFT_1421692 [Coprinopsis sp. MPI-PUGE-AT-0042]|nr:hypothetical protein BKA70DRAFT_1421692 [Coprinopsis sp. MPI-PUGE-AT-0042]
MNHSDAQLAMTDGNFSPTKGEQCTTASFGVLDHLKTNFSVSYDTNCQYRFRK